METIAHRELRNNSSAILARVAQGESFAVTNHGELTAVISPAPRGSQVEQILAAGGGRRSVRPLDIARLRPVRLDMTSAEVLADLRGSR